MGRAPPLSTRPHTRFPYTPLFLARDVFGTEAGTAAYGFAAYSLTMTAGRFAGDRLVAALGPATVLRVGGLLVAVGLGLGLLLHHPVAALLAFPAVGLGLSNIVPVLRSVERRVGQDVVSTRQSLLSPYH